jgi:hypothetical protein
MIINKRYIKMYINKYCSIIIIIFILISMIYLDYLLIKYVIDNIIKDTIIH